MKWHSITAAFLLVAGGLSSRAHADQPIMNMMPRWSGGWGYQFVEEYRHESDLLLGNRAVGRGLSEDIHILNIEAVYTWERSIRFTAKLPYVIDAQRQVFDGNGNVITQHDNGLGDLTLALPLKKYFNLDGRSGSWTLAPQLRVPLSGNDEYEVGDNAWGQGLFLGYETETEHWFFSTGITGWIFEGNEPAEVFASLDFGYNFATFGSSGQLLWETDYHWEDDGSHTLSAGPAIYWRYNDTVHLRFEWKHDFSDHQGILDHGNGDTFKIGIGFVF